MPLPYELLVYSAIFVNGWFVLRGIDSKNRPNWDQLALRLCLCSCVSLVGFGLAWVLKQRDAAVLFLQAMMVNNYVGMPATVLLLRDRRTFRRFVVAVISLSIFAFFLAIVFTRINWSSVAWP